MELQQDQLNQLSAWLSQMEVRMESCGNFMPGDVDAVLERIDKHKVVIR